MVQQKKGFLGPKIDDVSVSQQLDRLCRTPSASHFKFHESREIRNRVAAGILRTRQETRSTMMACRGAHPQPSTYSTSIVTNQSNTTSVALRVQNRRDLLRLIPFVPRILERRQRTLLQVTLIVGVLHWSTLERPIQNLSIALSGLLIL